MDMVHRELAPVAPFCIGWRYPVMVLRPDLSPDAMKKPKGGVPKKYDPEKLCAAIADSTAENPVTSRHGRQRPILRAKPCKATCRGFGQRAGFRTAGEGSAARQYLTNRGWEAAQRHLKGVV